jgi:replicative DNA helicase
VTPAVAERAVPHSLEAERAVLGAVLVNPDMFYGARGLDASDFFRVSHGRIWTAFERLLNRNDAVDFLTVCHELEAGGDLEEVGGQAYVSGLIDGVPRSSNIEAYAGIVRHKARRRQVASVARQMLADALDDSEDDADAVDRAERHLLNLGEARDRRGLVPIGELVAKVQPLIEDLVERKPAVLGIPTGLADLDADTRGMRPGELVIVAGRPSSGKSSLIGNIVDHAASEGYPAAVFSVEMREDDMTLRLLAARAHINFHAFMKGEVTSYQLKKISDAGAEISQVPLFIDDSSDTTLLEVRTACRRMKSQRGLSLLVIDYLQLMRIPSAENRNLAIGELSAGLKRLAKELDIAVVALSQLSRGPEHRTDKRPMLSDLRESGNLEQDADQVWLIHRPEMYEATDANSGLAELIIAKARNGPTGTVHLTWLAHQMRFANKASAPDEPTPRRLL